MKKNLPEALILALANPIIEARLRSICYRLKEKGMAYDYVDGVKVPYLDFLQYGISGIKFSKLNALFEK